MKNKKVENTMKNLIISLLLGILPSISYATNDIDKSTAATTETIEIINPHTFTSVNYQVLHREEFINSAQSLSEVLKNINGIQIRKISGLGNPVSISIRGSNTKQVNMYIDGQLINDSQFGGFDLNQIPTEQIQSIEISKNQALGTGSTPIGGVIRVNTYNPNQNIKKLSLAFGSFGYKAVNLLVNNAFEQHSLAFGGSYLISDNNYDYLVPQSFNNPSQSIEEPLRNNNFKKASLFINDNAQLFDQKFRFNLQYNKQNKALANYQNNSPENRSNLTTEGIRYGIQSYLDSDRSSFFSIKFVGLELDFYSDYKDEQYINRLIETTQSTNDYRSTKHHLGIKPNIVWRNINVNPFIEMNQQTFTSISLFNGQKNQCNGISACDIKAEQTQLLLGTRLEWQSEQYPINTYLLASKLSEKSTNKAFNSGNNIEKKEDNSYNSQELGINYHNAGFTSSANLSKGIRTPTMFELFGDRGSFKGNDDLLPEQASTITLGAKYRHSLGSFSASLYHQEVDNSIAAIFNASGVGTYTNIGHANIKGVELQAEVTLFQNITLSAQLNAIDSKTQSGIKAFNSKKLPGIYHQQYQLALSYALNEQWQLKLQHNLDEELYFNRSNKFQATANQSSSGNPADRSLTDLLLKWQLKDYHFSLSFNNLFNNTYQDLANRPAQGSSIQLKFSIEDI